MSVVTKKNALAVAPSPVDSGDSLRGALLWFALTFAGAGLGGWASSQAPEVYASLVQPGWAPPASVFGPVWSVLYVLMAVAAWQVWRYRRTVSGATGLALYAVALVPNVLWSWLFFGQRLGGWALVDLVILWALIALTVRFFWRVRPLFGALLLPLLAWVSFAGVLNAVLWMSNPSVLG